MNEPGKGYQLTLQACMHVGFGILTCASVAPIIAVLFTDLLRRMIRSAVEVGFFSFVSFASIPCTLSFTMFKHNLFWSFLAMYTFQNLSHCADVCLLRHSVAIIFIAMSP